jgi:RimJ/RimL family protein N-acetyltransferase
MDDTSGLQYVAVATTLPARPLIAHAARQPLVTDRLIIRPCTEQDLEALHVLRTQPEVMEWTAVGRIDADLAETRTKLDQNLPPHDADTYNFALCLRSSGQFIGMGGCHKMEGELGWPVIGYMFRQEFWGQGYATEFVKSFLEAYWKLPRSDYQIDVDRQTVLASPSPNAERNEAEELLTAITAESNKASQRILTKCGFRLMRTWKERDSQDPSGQSQVVLHGFGYRRPLSDN